MTDTVKPYIQEQRSGHHQMQAYTTYSCCRCIQQNSWTVNCAVCSVQKALGTARNDWLVFWTEYRLSEPGEDRGIVVLQSTYEGCVCKVYHDTCGASTSQPVVQVVTRDESVFNFSNLITTDCLYKTNRFTSVHHSDTHASTPPLPLVSRSHILLYLS
jgi:hypothetical protein